MTVTGAGPGIMQAGMEGAGKANSIGVSIRLPFESGANSIIAGDAKHVSMKYFFTRKLMLIKESQAFVCLPGGFGTLDETFELLTLTQTGKGMPVPIVLLDAPGDPYWESIDTFVRDTLIARGLVAANDTTLYTITDSCETAAAVIERFYSNYDSIRFVGDNLVMRMHTGPDAGQLAELNERFGHLVAKGTIEVVEPFKVGASRRRPRRPRPDRVQFLQARLQRADHDDRRDQRLRLTAATRRRVDARSSAALRPPSPAPGAPASVGGRTSGARPRRRPTPRAAGRTPCRRSRRRSLRSDRSGRCSPTRSLPDREDHVDRRAPRRRRPCRSRPAPT